MKIDFTDDDDLTVELNTTERKQLLTARTLLRKIARVDDECTAGDAIAKVLNKHAGMELTLDGEAET